MLDKIFLTLFGLEWFGFGVLGLFFPDIIAGMLGVTSYSESNLYLNETRALYAFFTILGMMSLMSIFNVNLRKKVYLTFAILMGSFSFSNYKNFSINSNASFLAAFLMSQFPPVQAPRAAIFSNNTILSSIVLPGKISPSSVS